MHCRSRWLAIAAALMLVAAACSKPASKRSAAPAETQDVIASAAPDAASVEPEASDGAGVTKAGANAKKPVTRVTAPTGAPLNPKVDEDALRAIGAKVAPQSTSIPGGNRSTWMGVTDKEIKVGFSIDEDICGVNTLTLIQALGGLLPSANRYYRPYPSSAEALAADRKEAAEHIIRSFNDNALSGASYYPQVRAIMGDDQQRPFYGRRIVHEVFDGGSFQCRDKSNSQAEDIVKNKKYFAVVNDSLDGLGFDWSNFLNAKAAGGPRPMHFGSIFLSDTYYSRWAPYSWTQFATGTTNTKQLASYVCTRLVGKDAVNSRQFGSTPRKFALNHPDNEQYNELAKEFRGYLKSSCGGTDPVVLENKYSLEVSRGVDEGEVMMINFRREGITSIIELTDLLFPFLQMQGAQKQQYFPEYVWAGHQYTDAADVQRLYDAAFPDQVDKASFGITNLGIPGGFDAKTGDPFWVAYHPYHKKSNDGKKTCNPEDPSTMTDTDSQGRTVENGCRAPQTIRTMYYSALPLAGGIAFAGPNLTPELVSKGLQAYPETRFGGAGPTFDPRPAQLGAGPGKYGFIVDATEWRWRVKYKAPPHDSMDGWVEYPDCQRHYISWPDSMALYWEKGGANFDAWCGDAKYAPPGNLSNGNAPEKDGYPRY